MSRFLKPQGVCFLFGDELPAAVLSNILCRIVSFLQNVEPYAELQRYEDWWQHDGLHFHRGSIDFNVLFGMINSPKSLLESAPADDYVFVGIAPNDGDWYLRFRAEWDDEGFNLAGSCVVILPKSLAEKFEEEVLRNLDVKAEGKESEIYYREIFQ